MAVHMKSLLFKRFMFSYIVILAVPLLLMGAVLYSNFIDVLTSEVEDSTSLALEQAVNIVDMHLGSANYISAQMEQNQQILSLLYAQDNNAITEYQYYNIVKEMKLFLASNDFIEDIFIYSRRKDQVVSTQGKYSKELFLKQIFKNTNMPQLDLPDLLDNASKQIIRTINTVNMDGSMKESIMYLQPMPASTSNHSATLLLTINASTVNKLLTSAFGKYKGNVYILDNKGNVISSILKSDIEMNNEKALSLIKTQDHLNYTTKINGKNVVVSYVKSTKMGWSYIIVIPSQQILKKVDNIRSLALVIIFLTIAIGLILSYYFAYGNYRPIKTMADSLPKDSLYFNENGALPSNGLKDGKQYSNELEMIKNVLTSTLSKDKALQERMESHIPLIRTSFILRLLKGDFENLDAAKNMSEYSKVRIGNGPFAVMVFNIDNYDEFKHINSEATQDLLKFAIGNVVEELAQLKGNGFTVEEANDNVTMIVDFIDSNSEIDFNLLEIGIKAREFFEKHFEFTLTVGIGKRYTSLLDISKSYIEAKTAIDYKIVRGKNTVIEFENIVINDDTRSYYSILHEKTLVNCLKTGDFEAVNQVLSNIISTINERPLSIRTARCIYFGIINTAMKVLAELSSEDYNEVIHRGNILSQFLKCETLNDLYQQTTVFYKNICERIQMLRKGKDSDFREKVLEYVNQNYWDSNFSLNFLSEKFEVSPSYLSRFFKSQLQCNFIEYLHGLRLQKAKELLSENEEKNIAKIAEQSGFTDSHSFIRTFKKYEGVTPGKFREAYHLKSKDG